MEEAKVIKPNCISVNDTVALVAMEMVIEGYKTKEISLIDKALQIMETFKDAPLIDVEAEKFEKKFGE